MRTFWSILVYIISASTCLSQSKSNNNAIIDYVPRTEKIHDTVFSFPVNPHQSPDQYLLKKIDKAGYYVYKQLIWYKHIKKIKYNDQNAYDHLIIKTNDKGFNGSGKNTHFLAFTYYSNGNVESYCSLSTEDGFYIVYDSLSHSKNDRLKFAQLNKYYCFKVDTKWYAIEEAKSHVVKEMEMERKRSYIKNHETIFLSEIFSALSNKIW